MVETPEICPGKNVLSCLSFKQGLSFEKSFGFFPNLSSQIDLLFFIITDDDLTTTETALYASSLFKKKKPSQYISVSTKHYMGSAKLCSCYCPNAILSYFKDLIFAVVQL